jgi:hypothetical protein
MDRASSQTFDPDAYQPRQKQTKTINNKNPKNIRDIADGATTAGDPRSSVQRGQLLHEVMMPEELDGKLENISDFRLQVGGDESRLVRYSQ